MNKALNLRVGEMWDVWPTAGLFLFTGNGTLTRDGRLVMGRGMAQQVRDRYKNGKPPVDQAIGSLMRSHPDWYESEHQAYVYHLLISPDWPEARLGVFQVKYNWRDLADIALINTACLDLALWLLDHPDCDTHLNFPGIGNGGLPVDLVYPRIRGILGGLPNLTLWTKETLNVE